MENLNLGNAFIEKTKKQAKRLLKLAQSKESTLKITSLASAQEILAQINGYPHWHALESTISKQPILSIFEKSHAGYDDNEKQEISSVIDGVNYFIKDNKLVSIFEVVNLPYSDITVFMSDIEHLKEKCALQFNMGFHEVSLVISHRNRESSHNDYNFYSLSNSLGIEESLIKKLFALDVSIEKKSKFFLSVLIIVKTDSQMSQEHAEFCSNFNKEFPEREEVFALRDYLTNAEKNLLNHEEKNLNQRVAINGEYDLSLEKIMGMKNSVNYSHKEILHKAWIHSINLLSKKNFEWDIEVDLNKNIFTFYQLQENKNNEVYLAGLYKSLNVTNDIVSPKMFDFENKKSNGIPWKKGIPFINHTDSELSYYEPGSSFQNTNNTLIYAKPGSGKSLLMSVLNLFSLGDKVSNLPYIGTVDIGTSSKSIIDFLKYILPLDKKNLVAYHCLKMTKEYCVNIFDTPLGSRFPNDEHKAFLSNFFLLLVGNTQEGLLDLFQAVIEDMYFQTSERGKPKKYDKGVNLKIDECLNKTKMKINEKSLWWDVVDNLFENMYFHEAMLAQRYAVPVFPDANSSIQNDKICDIYSRLITSTGESLTQYVNRSIADSLNQYQILGQPTLFDIGEARIVSLDLYEVAKSGGIQAQKQTAIMYMLARHIIINNQASIDEIPYANDLSISNTPVAKYKEYHRAKDLEYSKIRKIVCFDEFHRVSNTYVNNQVARDMREGRKNYREIIVSTQSLDDISDSITSFVTSFFIMGSGSKRDLESICQKLCLYNKEDVKMLSNVHGPMHSKPGVMFAKFLTNQGTICKLLSFQPTPHLLAMLSTTMEDTKLREKLLTKFSMEKTLDILVKEYPKSLKVQLEKEFGYPYPENFQNIIFNRLLEKYD